MSPEQYEGLLEDVRTLRRALGLPAGALDMTPRAAFRECIDEALAVVAEVRRLRDALEITREALRFYEADRPDAHDLRPWVYDYEQRRWYFTGDHPSDVADFALRKAGLAERGDPPPFEDYLGRAMAAALGDTP